MLGWAREVQCHLMCVLWEAATAPSPGAMTHAQCSPQYSCWCTYCGHLWECKQNKTISVIYHNFHKTSNVYILILETKKMWHNYSDKFYSHFLFTHFLVHWTLRLTYIHTRRGDNTFWSSCLYVSSDVLPVAVAILLYGVQEPHLLPRRPVALTRENAKVSCVLENTGLWESGPRERDSDPLVRGAVVGRVQG